MKIIQNFMIITVQYFEMSYFIGNFAGEVNISSTYKYTP